MIEISQHENILNYASKEEIFVENEEYCVPSEENKQLMCCVELTIGISSCRIGIHGKYFKHQGIIYKYFNKIGVNFPPVTIEDKYLIAILAFGEKVPNKTFYEHLLSAEVIHKQTLESRDIHQDPINIIDYVDSRHGQDCKSFFLSCLMYLNPKIIKRLKKEQQAKIYMIVCLNHSLIIVYYLKMS